MSLRLKKLHILNLSIATVRLKIEESTYNITVTEKDHRYIGVSYGRHVFPLGDTKDIEVRVLNELYDLVCINSVATCDIANALSNRSLAKHLDALIGHRIKSQILTMPFNSQISGNCFVVFALKKYGNHSGKVYYRMVCHLEGTGFVPCFVENRVPISVIEQHLKYNSKEALFINGRVNNKGNLTILYAR